MCRRKYLFYSVLRSATIDNGYLSYPPKFGSSASNPKLEDETKHKLMKKKEVSLKKENKKMGGEKGFAIDVTDFGEGRPSNSKQCRCSKWVAASGFPKLWGSMMATITILMRKRLRESFDEKEIKSHPTTIASKECGVTSFQGCCGKREKTYFLR